MLLSLLIAGWASLHWDGVRTACLGCRPWGRAGAQHCCTPCRRLAAYRLLQCCGWRCCAAQHWPPAPKAEHAESTDGEMEGLGCIWQRKRHVLLRVPRGERAQRHILQATALNKNCFTQPCVSQQHKGAQPISSTCTAALPAPKPSPARVLLAALQDTGLMLLHPKLSPTSTSHPTINIVQALSSDLKDVVHTGADIAETTVASCMAWVPLVWSCTALQAKWMLCSSFHSTAAALHNTGLTNPKANQGQHSRQETFPTTTMCSGTSFSPAAAVLGNAVRQKTEPRIGMCVTKTTSEGRAEVRGKRCDTPTRAAAEMG